MSERDKIRQQRLLESLAKKGFTVYNGKKVTFAEAQELKAAEERQKAELRANEKLLVLNDLKSMLGGWSINEHRLTTFVEAAKKCSFKDILEDLLQGKELSAKQVYITQELKRNLEFLTKHGDGATTILLPSIAEKLIAGVIVNFYDNVEYLKFTRELLSEGENNTVTLMEIYTGKITSQKISQLTSEQIEVTLEESQQYEESEQTEQDQGQACFAGEICDQAPDM